MRTLSKIIIALIILSTSIQAFAAQYAVYDVYFRFNDGSAHLYTNFPDSENGLAVLATQIKQDFPQRDLREIADAQMVPAGSSPPDGYAFKSTKGQAPQPQQQETSFWDSSSGKLVKMVLVVGGLVWVGHLIAKGGGSAGGCANPWDIAKDGSRCGGRAASVRPGGN